MRLALRAVGDAIKTSAPSERARLAQSSATVVFPVPGLPEHTSGRLLRSLRRDSASSRTVSSVAHCAARLQATRVCMALKNSNCFSASHRDFPCCWGAGFPRLGSPESEFFAGSGFQRVSAISEERDSPTSEIPLDRGFSTGSPPGLNFPPPGLPEIPPTSGIVPGSGVCRGRKKQVFPRISESSQPFKEAVDRWVPSQRRTTKPRRHEAVDHWVSSREGRRSPDAPQGVGK